MKKSTEMPGWLLQPKTRLTDPICYVRSMKITIDDFPHLWCL